MHLSFGFGFAYSPPLMSIDCGTQRSPSDFHVPGMIINAFEDTETYTCRNKVSVSSKDCNHPAGVSTMLVSAGQHCLQSSTFTDSFEPSEMGLVVGRASNYKSREKSSGATWVLVALAKSYRTTHSVQWLYESTFLGTKS
jgi:hypothetical protein